MKVLPMKGIVPGKGSVEIDIEYAPTRPETALLEVELHISQFGFEPIPVRITGSAQYADVVNQRKAKEEAQLKKAEEERKRKEKQEEIKRAEEKLVFFLFIFYLFIFLGCRRKIAKRERN